MHHGTYALSDKKCECLLNAAPVGRVAPPVRRSVPFDHAFRRAPLHLEDRMVAGNHDSELQVIAFLNALSQGCVGGIDSASLQ